MYGVSRGTRVSCIVGIVSNATETLSPVILHGRVSALFQLPIEPLFRLYGKFNTPGRSSRSAGKLAATVIPAAMPQVHNYYSINRIYARAVDSGIFG